MQNEGVIYVTSWYDGKAKEDAETWNEWVKADAKNTHGDKKGSLDKGFMRKQQLSDELANTSGRHLWQNLIF